MKTFKITVIGNDPHELLVRIVESDNEHEIKQYVNELASYILELGGSFEMNRTEHELVIHATNLSNKDIEDLCQSFSLESANITKEFLANARHIFMLRKEFKRVSSLYELQEHLSSIVKLQSTPYINVFVDDTVKDPVALIQYLETPITVPVERLGVRNVWSYTLSTEVLNSNVTHYDIDHKDFAKLMEWVSEIEELESKLEPAEVTQGLDEDDNEDLIHDLLLEKDKLYHFGIGDEHALRVFEHSVLHHDLPFVLYEDTNNDYNYVYISEHVDSAKLLKRLEKHNLINNLGHESVYIEDMTKLKHTGLALNLPTMDENECLNVEIIHKQVLTAIVSKG